MNVWLDTTLLLLVLTNLWLLGSSRLVSCIRVVAVQGVLLAALLLLAHHGKLTLGVWLPAAGSLALKGVVFPWLLLRALREANVRREVEPYVGFTSSVLAGLLALAVSLWLGRRLPLPIPAIAPLIVPVAFFSILAGLFLIVSRRQALTQVLGYLVLENGIYVFGVSLAQENPLLFELGVLLDVFVAVFVMGIMIFHISREFDHIDTERLSALQDWRP
jgi:hydrogenase-4 component E